MEFAVEEVAYVDSPVAPFEPPFAVYYVVLEGTAEDAQIHVEGTFALLLAVSKLACVFHVFVCSVVLPESMHFAVQKFAKVSLTCGDGAILRLPIELAISHVLLLLLLDSHTLIKTRFVSSLEVSFVFAAVSILLLSVTIRLAILPIPSIIIRIPLSDPMLHLSFPFNDRSFNIPLIHRSIRQNQIPFHILRLSLLKPSLIIRSITEDTDAPTMRQSLIPLSSIVGLLMMDEVNLRKGLVSTPLKIIVTHSIASSLHSFESA